MSKDKRLEIRLSEFDGWTAEGEPIAKIHYVDPDCPDKVRPTGWVSEIKGGCPKKLS